MNKNQDFAQTPGEATGKNTSNFYNTIHLQAEELTNAKKQVESQESKILDLLATYPTQDFTKSEIKTHLVNLEKISDRTPESSISRALTNLHSGGKILKLDAMRQGGLGKPNHLWKLKPEPLPVGTQTKLF
jgi:DNA-binding response OmpR family regulator